MTVVVLAVLWMIVVVPMVFRRRDLSSRERSVSRFRSGMSALGRGSVSGLEDQASYVTPRPKSPSHQGAQVFVHGSTRSAEELAPVSRRPVPAAEEALMYPVDRDDMSDARRQMMARVLALAFLGGLGSYMWFLRTQAMHDRERRASRQLRAVSQRRTRIDTSPEFAPVPGGGRPDETVVRIDDDDLELHNMDTVDLTGLYQEILEDHRERRAG
jgi:hypothetical protein